METTKLSTEVFICNDRGKCFKFSMTIRLSLCLAVLGICILDSFSEKFATFFLLKMRKPHLKLRKVLLFSCLEENVSTTRAVSTPSIADWTFCKLFFSVL